MRREKPLQEGGDDMEVEGMTSTQGGDGMEADAALMETTPLMILERKLKVARQETEKRHDNTVQKPWRRTR